MELYTDLLKFGFSVIPVNPDSKRPLVSWKAYQKRRPKERELYYWSERWPRANVGVVTGAVSGIIVLDLDSREAMHRARTLGLNKTPMVQTARGWHLYYRHYGEVVSNFAGKGHEGIDLRADGGYVVGPESVHETGVVYEWVYSPEDMPFAPLPFWIRKLITKPKEEKVYDQATPEQIKEISTSDGATPYGKKAFDEMIGQLGRTQKGGRNHKLFRVSVRLFELAKGGEIYMPDVQNALHATARLIGLPDREIEKTITSAYNSSIPKASPRN